jgi:hypothetical protein
MSTRTPYSYTILRYVHDISTGEFINVGVVVSSPDVGFIGARFKSAYSRVKNAFPTLRGEDFRARIQKLQSKFDGLQRQSIGQLPLDSGRKLMQIVHEVLPADDSALQWSPVGSGLSKDLHATVVSLHKRFVTKYDLEHQAVRRNDDDVWKDFKVALEKRHLIKHLGAKTIEVEDDGVRFEHAWKNGTWHCYEPLSFDLASGNSIKGKAHKWLGQLASLQDATEEFSVYFLVGKPSEQDLQTSYEQALSILRKGRGVQIVEESQIGQFSDQVAGAMAAHEAHGQH